MTVTTVLGEIEADKLGVTLMHEHIATGMDGLRLDWRSPDRRRDIVEHAVAVLRAAADLGLGTILDATTIEMGRDPVLLAEVSERSGVHIVCTSGFYTERHGLPAHFREMAEEELTGLFTAELGTGIGGTGIRSGVIKFASGAEGLTDAEASLVRVIGRVQQATSVAVITHTEGGGGDVQARALLESGVPAARIQIGHVDHKNSSMRYWWRLLGLGVTLGFDRVGALPFMDDTMRAAILAGFIAVGRCDQLTVSMDGVISHYGAVPAVYERMETPILHLLKTFIPQLRAFGVTEDDLRKILIANPRRLLSGE